MDFFEQVVEFNQAVLGVDRPEDIGLARAASLFVVHCFLEEADELADAVVKGDVVGQVDAIVDLMYFAVGALHRAGLSTAQMRECCSAVHLANMTKRRGVNAKRDLGVADAVKAPDWVGPEVRLKAILGVK